jgi:hypothetical protein
MFVGLGYNEFLRDSGDVRDRESFMAESLGGKIVIVG